MQYHDQTVFFSSREWNVFWSLIRKAESTPQNGPVEGLVNKIPLKDHLQGVKQQTIFFWGVLWHLKWLGFWMSIFCQKLSGLICQHLYEIHPSIRKTSWDMAVYVWKLLLDILKDVHRKHPTAYEALVFGVGAWCKRCPAQPASGLHPHELLPAKSKTKCLALHPWKLTWKLKINPGWKRRNIDPTHQFLGSKMWVLGGVLLGEVHSVDGSEIRLTCWSGTYPIFLQGFSTIPGGCLGFLPSTVTPDPSVKKGPKDI